MKKMNPFAVFFIASLLFYGISLLYKNNSIQKSWTVCLAGKDLKNSGDELRIDSFSLNNKGSSLNFILCNDNWFVSLDEGKNLTCADGKIVQNLLNNLRNNVKMYKISDDYTDFMEKNTGNSCFIWFYEKNHQTARNIYFGKTSKVTGNVFISIDEDDSVFEVKDVFSSFFNNDIDYWCAGEIFAEVSKPVKDGELLKYRHGKIADETVTGLKREFECSVADESGRIVSAQFYKKDENSYLLKKIIVPSKWDDENLKSLFRQSLDTVYEVSGWTVEKIKKIANSNKL